MPQTELETALASVYRQDLEKLAVDLLSEHGYVVDPTAPMAASMRGSSRGSASGRST